MKVLFINLPYYGHVVPTIGLVRELVKRRHQVTYLLPHDWADMLRGSGADFLGYPNHKKLSEQVKNAYAAAEAVAAGYDLIIYEQFFFLGKRLAERCGKPAARIFTAPAPNESIMRRYTHSGGAMGVFRCPWVAKLWTQDIAKALAVELENDSWLDEILYNVPDVNFVYTTREFQPDAGSFPAERFFFLGPSVYDRQEPELALPCSDAPLLYISLGTVLSGAGSFFRQCIRAFQGEKITVVLSVGKRFRPEKLGPVPANFIVRSFVPQLAVLKRADLFLTHGGMNSISEAMTFGVPMVVLPFSADQPLNAEQVERLGLGKRLDRKACSAQRLKETVFSVLQDPQIKRNAVEMREKIAHCPGNRGAADILERYVAGSF